MDIQLVLIDLVKLWPLQIKVARFDVFLLLLTKLMSNMQIYQYLLFSRAGLFTSNLIECKGMGEIYAKLKTNTKLPRKNLDFDPLFLIGLLRFQSSTFKVEN